MAYSLLMVGDLKRCAELLKKNASDQDMTVEVVPTGMQAMSAAEKGPDLVMLCADLPDVDGISWLKTLRHTDFGRELPVIVAADRRTDEMVANAFDWGADDYIL